MFKNLATKIRNTGKQNKYLKAKRAAPTVWGMQTQEKLKWKDYCALFKEKCELI